MKRAILIGLTVCFLTALLCPPSYSQSTQAANQRGKDYYNQNGALIMADLLVFRPLGIAACAVGAAGVIISLPFVAFSGGFGTVVDELLTKPGNFTFERRLGDFSFSD